MRRKYVRAGTVVAVGSTVALLTGTPGHTATMVKWYNPCDRVCQEQEMAVSPGLSTLVQVEASIPIATGTFALTTCLVGGAPIVGCVDRGFRIGPNAALTTGSTGCRAVNTYADGTQRIGTCELRNGIDPTLPGRAPVTVTTGSAVGSACSFTLGPATGKNDDGSDPNIVFVDGAGYQWRVVSIHWTAQTHAPRVEQGGTRWSPVEVTLVAELAGRTLTLQMNGRIESSGACEAGFLIANFNFDIGGTGTVAG